MYPIIKAKLTIFNKNTHEQSGCNYDIKKKTDKEVKLLLLITSAW